MIAVGKREVSAQERKRRQTEARVGLASNVLGLAAGAAATGGALSSPALRSPSLENAGPVTRRLLRGKPLSPRGRRLIRAGAIGALTLQAANVGGDVVANRVLSRESGMSKRDDRFLRRYRDRISPAAEEGYRYLRSGRNARLGNTAVSAGFAGLSGGLALHALRHGSKGWAAAGGAGALLSAAAASSSAKDAARWSSKMGKIRAKAREREAAGVYGMGRRPEVVKSIEQSIVSKSEPMRVTGRGVNLEKADFSRAARAARAHARADRKIARIEHRIENPTPGDRVREAKWRARMHGPSVAMQEAVGQTVERSGSAVRRTAATIGVASSLPLATYGVVRATDRNRKGKVDKRDSRSFQERAMLAGSAGLGGLAAWGAGDAAAYGVLARRDLREADQWKRTGEHFAGKERIARGMWDSQNAEYKRLLADYRRITPKQIPSFDRLSPEARGLYLDGQSVKGMMERSENEIRMHVKSQEKAAREAATLMSQAGRKVRRARIGAGVGGAAAVGSLGLLAGGLAARRRRQEQRSGVAKRNFNAEADRQRRLGLYAGLGIGSGIVAGETARRIYASTGQQRKDGFVKPHRMRLKSLDRKKAAALAASTAIALGGVGGGAWSYRRGVQERNQPWG